MRNGMEEKGVVMEGKWRVWFSLSAEDWNMHLSCVTMTRVIHPTSFLEGRAKAVTTTREMFGMPIRRSRCNCKDTYIYFHPPKEWQI